MKNTPQTDRQRRKLKGKHEKIGSEKFVTAKLQKDLWLNQCSPDFSLPVTSFYLKDFPHVLLVSLLTRRKLVPPLILIKRISVSIVDIREGGSRATRKPKELLKHCEIICDRKIETGRRSGLLGKMTRVFRLQRVHFHI